MKKLVKKIIPYSLVLRYRRLRSAMISIKFKKMTNKDIFTEIYKTNHWRSLESISGSGSESTQAIELIQNLEKLLNDLKIKTLLDIPCGDLNWMQKVNLSNIDYVGADIVEELIESNINQFKDSSNLKFKVLNLIKDDLPLSDIIIVRDCLVHLSYENIFEAIKKHKSHWL